MNQYVTGNVIKKLRENQKLTQEQLADKLNVSNKAVSKWETGRGFPDISMLESLANVLGVSVIELLSGEEITNKNKHANITRGKFYVCPVCGNVIFSIGEAVISCCGIVLPHCELESCESNFCKLDDSDNCHQIQTEKTEDEYFVTINHEMTKEHYISFIAAIQDNGVQIVKLYPEQPAQARFKIARTQKIIAYCNRHGGFFVKSFNTSK